MKVKRTKLKRTTPKSHTEYSILDLDMGGGLDKLLRAAARIIEKYFGLLYLSTKKSVLR